MKTKEPKNSINIQYYKTKIGELILGSYKGKLCLLDYRYRRMRATIDKRIQNKLNAIYVEQDNALLKETKKQIDQFLTGNIKEITVPILMIGSEFQKLVWKALMETKYGETSSYMDIAKRVNNIKAIRAVAVANGANCINLIVPCHRIIGSDGKLVGYGGGLPIKKRLLIIEKENTPSVDLFSNI